MQITEEMQLHKEWYKQANEQTMETLSDFINHLIKDYDHDYGTICHALAAGAVATCWAMNRTDQGGITGFQGHAVMWQFVWEWLSLECPLTLVTWQDMLYPQNQDKFEKTMSKGHADWLINKAKELLADDSNEHAAVIVKDHWQKIANGEIPFGYTVRSDDE